MNVISGFSLFRAYIFRLPIRVYGNQLAKYHVAVIVTASGFTAGRKHHRAVKPIKLYVSFGDAPFFADTG